MRRCVTASIEALARQQRAAVLALDRALARELIAAYAGAWARLRTQLDLLTDQIAAAGPDASLAWLQRQDRLVALERQVALEVGQISRVAGVQITAAQRQAVTLAEQHARAAVTLALGEAQASVGLSWSLLPGDAVRALVGSLAPGEPLTALLDALGPEAAQAVKVALTDGVILGEGPATIARRARAAFGGSSVRALRVARTETLRAYNGAARLSYQRSGVVAKWRWLAALTTRTCSRCWAMHGSLHDLDEPMATHVSCRCTSVPELLPAFAGDQPTPETGPEAFAKLDPDKQRQVLGPGKAAAYQAGALGLPDLVGTKKAGAWGRVGYEKSLTAAVGKDDARRFIREARSA